MKKIFLLIFLFSFLILPKSVFGMTFDLIPPEGELKRGQEIKFIVNIDTEGKSYSSVQIGMTYETQYLEYISTSAGDTFTNVSADNLGEGKLILTGTSNSPYSGKGVFAYVTFKIIADAPGSTQLCALYNPDITPTAQPTRIIPTALPTSGIVGNVNKGIFVGVVFLFLSAGFFVLKNT